MPSLDWMKLGLDSLQFTAVIAGGLYTLYEYRRFRRYGPKIQFALSCDLHPIDKDSESHLLNIKPNVKNLGRVRMTFPEIIISVKTLNAEDIEKGLASQERLAFGRELVKKHNIVFDPEDPWWVDPGVTQAFPYPVVIEKPASFIQVNSRFYYYEGRENKKRGDYHQASIVIPVSG